MTDPNIRFFTEIGLNDVPSVGGKNASLGEMIRHLEGKGIKVPPGFATTATAYWRFLEEGKLKEKIISLLNELKKGKRSLQIIGKEIRQTIISTPLPKSFADELLAAYAKLGKMEKKKNIAVAVRSSATAEDLPTASFAGQQESYLNIQGEKALLDACRRCFASLFTDRAITYREAKGFDHMQVALSVGVQKMVRSDKAGSGVMFTLDTETGFPRLIVINAAFGLGENVVQGTVDPDEYQLFKPLLSKQGVIPIIEKALGQKQYKMVYTAKGGGVKNTKLPLKERGKFVLNDEEILQLARWGCAIEEHYKKSMDIEWAKDGGNGKLYIVQARPETVQSRKSTVSFKTMKLKKRSKVLVGGLAIGEAIAAGKAQVIKHISEIGRFKPGGILITEMTTPDWVPIMKKAIGIITDHGGRTSHAAIMSRELNLPAIVGTEKATKVIANDAEITLSCAEGERGFVYQGILPFEEKEIDLTQVPELKTQIMMNIASPEGALSWWRLPCKGIGLARMEFIIDHSIKIHPMALLHPKKIQDKKAESEIKKLTAHYKNKSEYFIDKLSQGIGRIAASQFPYPVIVRLSDFKTNEYANLIGGKNFEPKEENPMLGFRGASRYYNPRYKEGFALECAALKRVREVMGLTNVIVMIPFCRTLEEADKVLKVMEEFGLKRDENDLKIYMMAEIPSNILLVDEFSERFDGFSIGSNDLTQLTLGIDRDSEELAELFDERNLAVKRTIETLIKRAHDKGVKVGICGQAPSDYPEFAQFLVSLSIDSLSLNPDSVLNVIQTVAEIEKKR
jgi:pyruvate, water dikinase